MTKIGTDSDLLYSMIETLDYENNHGGNLMWHSIGDYNDIEYKGNDLFGNKINGGASNDLDIEKAKEDLEKINKKYYYFKY